MNHDVLQVCPPGDVGPHHIGPHPRHQVGSCSSSELTQLSGNENTCYGTNDRLGATTNFHHRQSFFST